MELMVPREGMDRTVIISAPTAVHVRAFPVAITMLAEPEAIRGLAEWQQVEMGATEGQRVPVVRSLAAKVKETMAAWVKTEPVSTLDKVVIPVTAGAIQPQDHVV